MFEIMKEIVHINKFRSIIKMIMIPAKTNVNEYLPRKIHIFLYDESKHAQKYDTDVLQSIENV